MKTKWDIVPLLRFGPVDLGVSRVRARSVFASTPETFRKGARGPSVDAWHDGSFQVFYANCGRQVEYIEASRGDTRPFEPWFLDIPLFETPADDVVTRLAKVSSYDRSHPAVGFSYVFPEWDLSLWRPVLPTDDPVAARFFSTVGMGVKGYYSAMKRPGKGG